MKYHRFNKLFFSVFSLLFVFSTSAKADDLAKAHARCGYEVSRDTVGKRYSSQQNMMLNQGRLMEWCMKGEGYYFKEKPLGSGPCYFIDTGWNHVECWVGAN